MTVGQKIEYYEWRILYSSSLGQADELQPSRRSPSPEQNGVISTPASNGLQYAITFVHSSVPFQFTAMLFVQTVMYVKHSTALMHG